MLKKTFICILIFALFVPANSGIGIHLKYKFKPGMRYKIITKTNWIIKKSPITAAEKKVYWRITANARYVNVFRNYKKAKINFYISSNIFKLNNRRFRYNIPGKNVTFTMSSQGVTDLSKYSGTFARSFFYLTFPKELIAPGRDSWDNYYYFYGNKGNIRIKLTAKLEKLIRYRGRSTAVITMTGNGKIGGYLNKYGKPYINIKNTVYFDYINGRMILSKTAGNIKIERNGNVIPYSTFISTTIIR